MSTFHCWSGDFTRETRFYLSLQFGSYSLCLSENNAFSVMCDVCRKPVKRVFWAQIARDICTRFERYLFWRLQLDVIQCDVKVHFRAARLSSRNDSKCRVHYHVLYIFIFGESQPISPRQVKENSKHKNIPFIKWLELVLSLLTWLV